MKFEAFGEYWFGMFGVVAVLDREGDGESGLNVDSERDWEKECLGTFYVKPNYPGMPQYLPVVIGKDSSANEEGRCSHVCNAGFLTTIAARNQGVGMVMGKAYLHFAPLLVCHVKGSQVNQVAD